MKKLKMTAAAVLLLFCTVLSCCGRASNVTETVSRDIVPRETAEEEAEMTEGQAGEADPEEEAERPALNAEDLKGEVLGDHFYRLNFREEMPDCKDITGVSFSDHRLVLSAVGEEDRLQALVYDLESLSWESYDLGQTVEFLRMYEEYEEGGEWIDLGYESRRLDCMTDELSVMIFENQVTFYDGDFREISSISCTTGEGCYAGRDMVVLQNEDGITICYPDGSSQVPELPWSEVILSGLKGNQLLIQGKEENGLRVYGTYDLLTGECESSGILNDETMYSMGLFLRAEDPEHKLVFTPDLSEGYLYSMEEFDFPLEVFEDGFLTTGYIYSVDGSGDFSSHAVVKRYREGCSVAAETVTLPEKESSWISAVHQSGNLVFMADGFSGRGIDYYLYEVTEVDPDSLTAAEKREVDVPEAEGIARLGNPDYLTHKDYDLADEVWYEDASLGIGIYYGDQVCDLDFTGYTCERSSSEEDLESVKSMLHGAFVRMPEGFLDEIIRYFGGLDFYLVTNFVPVESDSIASASGLTDVINDRLVVMLDVSGWGVDETIAHEFMHVIDRWLERRFPWAFSDWNTLNPEGFEYVNAYHLESGEELTWESSPEYTAFDTSDDSPERIWFIDPYSKTYELEDRARLFEKMFTGYGWYSNEFSSSHIGAKIECLNMTLRTFFDSLRDQDSIWWEAPPYYEDAVG